MSLDTVNRKTDKGRRMRVWVGDQGPLVGVQAFESTATEAIERFGEYDSEEQVIDVQTPETTGYIEMIDSENTDFLGALQGIAGSAVVDVDVTSFGSPWIVCNVWNSKKTTYTKSVLVKKPVFHTLPYTTTLNDTVMARYEFAASRMVRMPKHACYVDKVDAIACSSTTHILITLSETAVQLSGMFLTLANVKSHCIGACVVRTDAGSGLKSFAELTVVATTSTKVLLKVADGVAFTATDDILVYYPVDLSAKTVLSASGLPCGTSTATAVSQAASTIS